MIFLYSNSKKEKLALTDKESRALIRRKLSDKALWRVWDQTTAEFDYLALHFLGYAKGLSTTPLPLALARWASDWLSRIDRHASTNKAFRKTLERKRDEAAAIAGGNRFD